MGRLRLKAKSLKELSKISIRNSLGSRNLSDVLGFDLPNSIKRFILIT